MGMNGRVAAYIAPGEPMEFREYPVPDPAPGDMIVRMRACNICGSDLHHWRGHDERMNAAAPQVLGHEMVGTVDKLGANVTADSLGRPHLEGDRILFVLHPAVAD